MGLDGWRWVAGPAFWAWILGRAKTLARMAAGGRGFHGPLSVLTGSLGWFVLVGGLREGVDALPRGGDGTTADGARSAG